MLSAIVSMVEFALGERPLGIFVLVTVLLGGGASWLTGRAIAATWRPWWNVVAYMLVLGAVVRFFHFALFEETLLSPYYYAVDTLVCLIFGLLGFRIMRVTQMVAGYGWINERDGAMSWRRRPASHASCPGAEVRTILP